MYRDALNSVTSARENELLMNVNNDVMEQLSSERITHQQIVSGLQQKLDDAAIVRNTHLHF